MKSRYASVNPSYECVPTRMSHATCIVHAVQLTMFNAISEISIGLRAKQTIGCFIRMRPQSPTFVSIVPITIDDWQPAHTVQNTCVLRNSHSTNANVIFVNIFLSGHTRHGWIWIIVVHGNGGNTRITGKSCEFFCHRVWVNALAFNSRFKCVRESFWMRKRKIAPNYLWVIHLVWTHFFPAHNSFWMRAGFGVRHTISATLTPLSTLHKSNRIVVVVIALRQCVDDMNPNGNWQARKMMEMTKRKIMFRRRAVSEWYVRSISM